MWDGIIVRILLFRRIPMFTRGAVTKFLHQSFPKMILSPPALIPFSTRAFAPGLANFASLAIFKALLPFVTPFFEANAAPNTTQGGTLCPTIRPFDAATCTKNTEKYKYFEIYI
jgi:hypothetical protein